MLSKPANRSPKSSRTRVGIAIVVCTIVSLFVLRSQDQPQPLTEDARGWQATIRDVGPEKAYELFQQAVNAVDQGSQHSAAHAFGAALYVETKGSGFPICRDVFEYGCAHGFISRALQERGITVTRNFAATCRTQGYPSMCMHGIGHGLVSSLGYSEDEFKIAVHTCRAVVNDTSVAGCIGGAVMEYGLKSMSSGEPLREMTTENRYEPCVSIDRGAKSSCYFWLPGWWYSVFTSTRKLSSYNAIIEMGSLCAALPESEHIAACFGGIGDMATVASSYNGVKTASLCDASSADHSYRLFCKAYAANILLGDVRTTAEATSVCYSLSGRDRDRCEFMAYKGVSLFDTK